MGFPERCVDCQGITLLYIVIYVTTHFLKKISGNDIQIIQRFVELLRYILHHMCSICVLYVAGAGHHQVAGEDLVAEMEQKEDKGRPYHGYPLVI